MSADAGSSRRLERAIAPSVEVGGGETCALVRVPAGAGDTGPLLLEVFSAAAAPVHCVPDADELCEVARLSRAESFELNNTERAKMSY